MTRAVLSMGSNLGDRVAHLQGAVDTLRTWLVAVSPVYETAPWGPVPQDDYLNLVAIVCDEAGSARTWLERARSAEEGAHRSRAERWGPRTLDVDVVSVDGVSSDDPELMLPHPRAHERAFVLVPWLAVDPHGVLGTAAVSALVAALPASELAGVRLRPELVVT